MELKVWVDGVERSVSGVTENTTCTQLIYALAHATGQKGKFVLVESFRNTERSLSPSDRPLETLQKWKEKAKEVTLLLRRVDILDLPPPSAETSFSTSDTVTEEPLSRFIPSSSISREVSNSSMTSAGLSLAGTGRSSEFLQDRSTSSLPSYSMSSLQRRRPPPPDYSLAIERKLAGLRVEAENDRLSGELSESLLPGRCSEKELLNIIIKQQSVLEEQRNRLKEADAQSSQEQRELLQLDAQQKNLRSVLEVLRKNDWGKAYEEETRRHRQLRARLLATQEKLHVIKESKKSLLAQEEDLWEHMQAVKEDLAEMARSLGFPRIISISNFQVPNFNLMAELLEWIVKRFEPSIQLSSQCSSEEERIYFIKTAVITLLQTARLKMNPKMLYQADVHAVTELLKPMKVLHAARQQQSVEELNAQWSSIKGKLNAKMQEVRICRQISGQLPQSGSLLCNLLSKDVYLRNERQRATTRTISVQDAEKAIMQCLEALTKDIDELSAKLNSISHDEQVLDDKIERRKREFEQLQKRYAKLQTFRPAHQDEYEKYEKMLKDMYEKYVVKFRCLAFLRQLCSEMERADQQKSAEAERNMRSAVERMRNEQREKQAQEDAKDMASVEEADKKVRRVFGNMVGAGLSDEDDVEDEEQAHFLINDEKAIESDESEREYGPGSKKTQEKEREDFVATKGNEIAVFAVEEQDEEHEKISMSSDDDF